MTGSNPKPGTRALEPGPTTRSTLARPAGRAQCLSNVGLRLQKVLDEASRWRLPRTGPERRTNAWHADELPTSASSMTHSTARCQSEESVSTAFPLFDPTPGCALQEHVDTNGRSSALLTCFVCIWRQGHETRDQSDYSYATESLTHDPCGPFCQLVSGMIR